MAETKEITNPARTIRSMNLSKAALPEPTINTTRYTAEEMVRYGTNNAYPVFLLKLYSESPTHGAIVNSKSTYIYGDGLRYKGGAKLIDPLNTKEPLAATIDKCIKDYIIFNFFAVEVLYNRQGQPVQYIHVPAHLIRTNMNRSKFWYRDNWAGNISKLIEYAPSDTVATTEEEKTVSKMFFFDGYFPSANLCYPAPEYVSAVKSIATDAAVNTFNLNNIKNHFSLSTLITFFMGSNIDKTAKDAILKELTDSYTGEDGKKIVVDFQTTNGKSAVIQNISPNTWDKAYEVVGKKASNDIFIGHQVTSPMLMGVKTEGQLGGATELEISYEIFKLTYVNQKRLMLEAALNRLFKGSAIVTGGAVEFVDKPLFGTRVSDTTLEKIMTVDELRAVKGLPPLPGGVGNRLLTDPIPTVQLAPTPALPAPVPTEVNQDDERTLAPAREPEAPAKPTKPKGEGWERRGAKEEDFVKVAHLGSDKSLFTVVSRGPAARNKFEAQVIELNLASLDAITEHIVNADISGKTIAEILESLKAAGLETTADELNDVFDRIKEAGVADIEVSDGKIEVKPNKVEDEPDKGKIVTMYEYVLRSGVDGPDLLPTSRGFCVKLVENNKYYSREDIQSMSSIFGYDVYKHAGGWWHKAGTDEVMEHCRHEFRSVRLKRK